MVDSILDCDQDGYERYFRENPDIVNRLAFEVAIDEFNAATLALYRAPNREALWTMALGDFRTADEYRAFCNTVAAFARGEMRCVVESWEKTYDGKDICVRDTVFIPTETQHNWARVVHMLEDVTARKGTGTNAIVPDPPVPPDDPHIDG